MALGFENAGFQTQMLIEMDHDACSTLRKNWPTKNIIERDVSDFNFDTDAPCDEIDVVCGGFPCQAFSYAGQCRGFDDAQGTHFYESARYVRNMQPKVAVGENVRGLLSHDGGRTLETMLTTLREFGYHAETRLFRSQFLDVPRKRERLFIVGVRKDVQTKPIFPQEQNYTMTVREALREVPESGDLTF